MCLNISLIRYASKVCMPHILLAEERTSQNPSSSACTLRLYWLHSLTLIPCIYLAHYCHTQYKRYMQIICIQYWQAYFHNYYWLKFSIILIVSNGLTHSNFPEAGFHCLLSSYHHTTPVMAGPACMSTTLISKPTSISLNFARHWPTSCHVLQCPNSVRHTLPWLVMVYPSPYGN